jgi:RNA polymerase sigma-70 factor, ECF subfamily
VGVLPMHPRPALHLVEEDPVPVDDVDAVFRRYARYVASIALRLLGRDDEVDDVVQDVFIAAMHGLRELREPVAIKGWLATVTVRVSQRRLRWRRFRSLVGRTPEPDYSAIAVAASQDQALLIRRAYRVLDRLPVAEKVAWILRNVEGESLASVAAMCGCSLATAKRRIASAQAVLDAEVDA